MHPFLVETSVINYRGYSISLLRNFLSNFYGIYRFLPVLTEILAKTSFFFHFMHLFGYKTVSLYYERHFMQQFGKIRLPRFA